MGKKAQLIKLYHVLCGRLGLSEADRKALVSAYDANSSTDLSERDLQDLCKNLKSQLVKAGKEPAPAGDEKARLQLRVKAACGNLLALQGKIAPKNWGPRDWGIIMGTICNASGKKEFLSLTKQELKALSFEFNRQRKALEEVKKNTVNL